MCFAYKSWKSEEIVKLHDVQAKSFMAAPAKISGVVAHVRPSAYERIGARRKFPVPSSVALIALFKVGGPVAFAPS